MKISRSMLRSLIRRLVSGVLVLANLCMCTISCRPETVAEEVEASVEAAVAKTREIELIRTQAAEDFSSTLTAEAPTATRTVKAPTGTSTVEAASLTSTRTDTATAAAETEASRAPNRVVVVVSSVSLRNGPGVWYNVLGYLYRGDFADVFAKSNIDGEWYNVRLDDGTVGWISNIGVEPENAFDIELVPTVATLPPAPPTKTPVPTITPTTTPPPPTPEPSPAPRASSTPTTNPYPFPEPSPSTPTPGPTENPYP